MRRGDVHALPAPRRTRGHEQRGGRYAVVVQSDSAMVLSTVVVCPTSTNALATIFRPEIEIRGRRTRVLTEQIRSLERSRIGRRVGTLAHSEMRSVDEALRLVLGLV